MWDNATLAAAFGALTAVCTVINNVISARNSRKIQEVHDCLDQHAVVSAERHVENVAAISEIASRLPTIATETYTGPDRRKQDLPL
jgi:hypothetical protein